MKTIATLLFLFNALLVLGQITNEETMVDYFTDNGLSATVKTMQHPAGEYHNGITYVCYQGPLEDPYVAAYDHKKEQWSGPFKAGESILGKNPEAKIDNHGKPAMIIDYKGYIHLVFGGHGGLPEHGINTLGNTHLGAMKHVVSKKPLDITEWEELDNIPPFGTYNQFVKMDNGDIYLFYRHGAHRSNWVYQLSTDNGRSFGQPISVLKTKKTSGTKEQPDIHDTWYAWFENGQGNDIIVTYNYHVCKEPDHDGERHNCYFMVMDTENKEVRNVKGEKIAMPVTKELADDKTLVANTDTLWTVRGTVRLDKKSNPHIIFYQGEHLGLKHGGPKQVIYYRWTGKKWITAESTGLPVATGDIMVSAPENASLLLAGKKDGTSELAWWNTTDGGQSFTKGEVLFQRNKTGITTTALIRNAHPDALVVISGNHKGNFKKLYLIGEKGSIKRLKVEANQLED